MVGSNHAGRELKGMTQDRPILRAKLTYSMFEYFPEMIDEEEVKIELSSFCRRN
jgi:hypothetical protein